MVISLQAAKRCWVMNRLTHETNRVVSWDYFIRNTIKMSFGGAKGILG